MLPTEAENVEMHGAGLQAGDLTEVKSAAGVLW